jgi:hypothetical protein
MPEKNQMAERGSRAARPALASVSMIPADLARADARPQSPAAKPALEGSPDIGKVSSAFRG